MGFHWVFIGFSLGFQSVFNGFSLGFQWVFIGFSFGFQSVFNGFSLGGERFFEQKLQQPIPVTSLDFLNSFPPAEGTIRR